MFGWALKKDHAAKGLSTLNSSILDSPNTLVTQSSKTLYSKNHAKFEC